MVRYASASVQPANTAASGDVPPGLLDVGSAGWGRPLVPARFRLGDFPAGRLFYLVAAAASRSRVACVGPPALGVRDGMFKI